MLVIAEETYAAIVAHARRDHPDEACGVVAGPFDSDRPQRPIGALRTGDHAARLVGVVPTGMRDDRVEDLPPNRQHGCTAYLATRPAGGGRRHACRWQQIPRSG